MKGLPDAHIAGHGAPAAKPREFKRENSNARIQKGEIEAFMVTLGVWR